MNARRLVYRGRRAVGGLVILRVYNNMCGAVGVSDSQNFARCLCVLGSFCDSPMGYDVVGRQSA